MKSIIALIAICCLALTALGAKSDQEIHDLPPYNVESFGTDLKAPIPVYVARPQLSKGMVGMEILLTFKISKHGYVHSIYHNASPSDQEEMSLVSTMRDCLRYWRFNPAVDKEGNAVAVKVNLPIKVVKRGDLATEGFAGITLDDPVLVAVLDR